ncbi:MAG: hypothetical protein HC911_00215 [Chloroflexaceae bacterium]|nr:hypothetical protein [Chloroflexaceae bacterium]
MPVSLWLRLRGKRAPLLVLLWAWLLAACASPPLTPTITSPSPAATFPVGAIPVQGTGTAGTAVEVLVNGSVAGTATVSEQGAWLVNISFDTPAVRQISARIRDADGRVGIETEPFQVTVTAPVRPAVQSPTLEVPADPVAGEIVLRGTSETMSMVVVIINESPMGAYTLSGTEREWSIPVTLAAGEYRVRVLAMEPNTLSVFAESPSVTLLVRE